MKKITTPIAGVNLVELSLYKDERGSFTRWFCEHELEELLNGKSIVQANHSITKCAGAIRGMHYQSFPHAEIKFIRCIRGRVFDVVVDLRENSPTFLAWYGVELSEKDHYLLVVPEGCAHGFQVMDRESELLYLHTEYYNPEAEGGVRYDDPAIGIEWPLKPTDLSERDKSHPLITNTFAGLMVG